MRVESFEPAVFEEDANEISPFRNDVGFTRGASRLAVTGWKGEISAEYGCVVGPVFVFAEEVELQRLRLGGIIAEYQPNLWGLSGTGALTPRQTGYSSTASEQK